MKYISTTILLLIALIAAAVEPSGSLPVLHINTVNNVPITSKEDYVDAFYYLDPMGDNSVEAIGTAQDPLPLQIRGRGNWTWKDFEKKPYRLKLEKKAPLMGLDNSRHFALLAHADDQYGFLRNPVGFKISSLMGMPWTPGEAPVEVILNGEYIGLYFLTETIRVSKDRVNIVEQPDLATDPETITGGWLVEIDNFADDPHVTVNELWSNYPIWFTYKTPEVLSKEQEQYLLSQMTEINDKVYVHNTNNCQWAGLVDLDILAKFYITQEITDNRESFHGSCYLNKQQGSETRWEFGPVWDFGCTFGYKSDFIYQGWNFHQVWIEQMCAFPAFMDVVKTQWKTFYSTRYLEMMTFVKDYAERIKTAAARNYQRWPQYGNADEMERANKVLEILEHNCYWLAQQWGGTEQEDPGKNLKVWFVDNTSNPWNPVYAFSWVSNKALIGDWPGTRMSNCELNGEHAWEISFNVPSTVNVDDLQIIFSDGQSGVPEHQTADLPFVDGKVYYRTEDSSIPTYDIEPEAITITALPGTLIVDALEATALQVATIDGRYIILNVPIGQSAYTLPRGIYIVAGRKYVL